jgi:uncharacterized membrane protein
MEKKLPALIFFAVSANASFACTTCNKELQQEIYSSTFYPNLFIMLSAFILLAVLVFALTIAALRRHKAIVTNDPAFKDKTPVPLTTASIVLGIGLGGFIDGIVFHQLLQWHEVLSNRVPVDTVIGKSVNMFWDGVFHAFCLIVVFIGVLLLWKLLFRADIIRSGKLLSGGLLLGWGLFNLVEGVIDHHILKLHNVKEVSANPELWNLAFLGITIVMIIIGSALVFRKSNYKVA